MPIRQISENDLPRCGEIYARAFSAPPYFGDWTPSSATEMLAGLLHRDTDSSWCVEVDGEIVGFAFCTTFGSFRATIQEFAIDPDYQGRGFGTKLMAYVLDRFARKKLIAVDLVVNRDAAALKLYEKFGFRHPDRYMIMAKHL